jgi:hypothetical protein
MKALFASIKSKIALSRVLSYFILTCVCSPSIAQIEAGQEYKLKAVFIYHFTKYFQWSFSDTSGAFEIAIIGNSNIIDPLKEIAEKRLVKGRRIEIKRFQDVEDIDACHILFIPVSETNQLDKILQRVKTENILTISDSKGFANRGVAINFVLVKEKIKFEINSRALERAGLQASSQLQKLAILVEAEGE